MNWLILLGFIIFSCIIGLGVWVLILKFKEHEIPLNDQRIINLMPQYSEGHGRGNILEIYRGEKRTGIKFLPTDVDYRKILSKKDKVIIKPYIVWYDNRKIVPLSKGTGFSNHEHTLLGLPPRAEDLSPELKNTEFGKSLMLIIADAENKNQEMKIVRSRLEVQEKLLEKTEGLGIIEDFSSKVQEIVKDLTKLTGQDKKPNTTFSPTGGN